MVIFLLSDESIRKIMQFDSFYDVIVYYKNGFFELDPPRTTERGH